MEISTCPAAEELKKLIEGTLSGERQLACTQHMDACTCCQSKLEELATDGSNLTEILVQADAVQPAASSAYWHAIKELSAEVDPEQTYVPKPLSRSRELSLTFLQPPTDPAYLGRLANFDVMRVIGRGGMGIVLEAFDSKLQRHVALKVLDPELAGETEYRQRFCREARAAASISHENVIAVHQVEHSSGEVNLPYLVMQLVSGESLEQRLQRESRLPLPEIIRIAMETAHGLVAAHAQGLVHRDIKPGNILLEPPGDRVKLTDFGLARIAEDVKITRPGFVTGTPLYMAPEQALGLDVDFRSDLFSFGAILYEMCAGKPPFSGNSALVILKQIAESPHPPLRDANPELPDWLVHTVDRLLEKNPDDRIQSASQLAELLDYEWALLKTNTEDVPAVCQIEKRKRARTQRRIAVAVGAAFLMIGLLGGVFLSSRMRPAAERSVLPAAMISANAGAVWSVVFSPDGARVAMAVEDGSVRLWDPATNSVVATLAAHRGTIWSLRYSPDGTHLATAGDDGLLKVWDLAAAGQQLVLEHPNAVRGVEFGKDPSRLIDCSKDGRLRIWSLTSGTIEKETVQPGAVYALAVSPDGETLATAGSDRVVRLWNTNTLSQKLPLDGHAGPVYGLSFSPDGRHLASAGWDRIVRIWETGTGQLARSWSGHTGDIWSVAFSPDGTRLATAGTDGAAKLWDAESGTLLQTFHGHENAIHTVAFNRDGTQIATGGRDGSVRVWNVHP